MSSTLYDVLVDAARTALSEQDGATGAMPAGHNGPYRDPETPVRNTAHWLVTFLHAAEHTEEDRFREAARRAFDYLASAEARPNDKTFVHRNQAGKDHCNGLVGQAWTLEALAEAAAADLRANEARALAAEVFLLHPFDERFALWKRVEVDGRTLPYDRTFNHQLWFAAAGGLLAATGTDSFAGDLAPALSEVDARVRQFLDHLPQTIRLYGDGLVRHPLRPRFEGSDIVATALGDRWRLLKNECFSLVRPPSSRRRLRTKAVGYHSFNLYALALLRRAYTDHPIWEHRVIDRVLAFLRSETYAARIEDNPYGYPYNPPGFEAAFAIQVLGRGDRDAIRRWVSRQLDRCYDPSERAMIRSTPDERTGAARIYEATRLDDVELQRTLR